MATKSRLGCGWFLGGVYDILAQTISVLDVTTDIIVCIQYYSLGRTAFFGLSATILFLALIAYTAAFVHFFSNEHRFVREVELFFISLPFSPLIPFIFFYADKEDSCLQRILEKGCCFNIDFSGSSGVSPEASKLKQFFEKKIRKHLGFILESLVEGISTTSTMHSFFASLHSFRRFKYTAFPQAILQMTSIVIYNEANIIAIISIFISLLSVASKSFVFSLGTANNLKQLFFNWLSAVTDFFGIFFVVSWVWYKPHDEELHDAFAMIQTVWFYKLGICEVPMIVVPGVLGYVTYVWAIITEQENGACLKKICIAIAAFFVFSFFLAAGIIAAALVLEITTWTWLAVGLVVLSSGRLPEWNRLSLEFYFTMIEWINNAESHRVGSRYKGYTSYTKQQDKIMRICSVNNVLGNLPEVYFYDDTFMQYLKENEKNQYMNVTMKSLRCHTSNPEKVPFVPKFWRFYSTFLRELWTDRSSEYDRWKRDRSAAACNLCCLTTALSAAFGSAQIVFAPLYVLSRVVHILFPAFIVLYLWFGYEVNVWNTRHIDVFQVAMISVYMAGCCVLSVLAYFNMKEQYILSHILPSKTHLEPVVNSERVMEEKIKKITNHYLSMTYIPIRKAMIIEHFGPDLGPIIVSYLPATNEEFEDVAGVVKVKTVL